MRFAWIGAEVEPERGPPGLAGRVLIRCDDPRHRCRRSVADMAEILNPGDEEGGLLGPGAFLNAFFPPKTYADVDRNWIVLVGRLPHASS